MLDTAKRRCGIDSEIAVFETRDAQQIFKPHDRIFCREQSRYLRPPGLIIASSPVPASKRVTLSAAAYSTNFP
jgi:hypothetical protein